MANTLANTNGKVREWIGPRIIPVFADDPQWNINTTYEPLMMVQNMGETFMSRQYVPAGIELPDTGNGQESNDYWVHMSNWNAQVEGYRDEVLRYSQQVLSFDERITQNSDDIDTLESGLSGVNADIDTLESELSTTNGNVTSLSNSVDSRFSTTNGNVASLSNSVDSRFSTTNGNVTALIERVDDLEQTEFVVLGDSWSAPTASDSIWPTVLTNIVNMNLHRYAVSGACFYYGNTLVSQQVTQLSNDNAFDKDKVKYVVILGGINDYRNNVTVDNLASAVNTVINNVRGICPKAKILFVSNAQYPYTKSQSQYWITLYDRLATNQCVSSLILDGLFPYAFWNTANYFHLTQTGQRLLAKYIWSALTGGEISYRSCIVNLSDSNATYKYEVTKMSRGLIGNFIITPKIAATSYSFNPSGNVQNLPWHDAIEGQFGLVGRSYTNVIADVRSGNITVASQANLVVNVPYVFPFICTLES